MAKVQNQSTKNDQIIKDLPMACSDEQAAVEFMEKQRWADHPACPECGSLAVYQMQNSKTGLRQVNYRWRCRDCKKQYTVRTGTVFEDSRIELRHWCFAFWRAATSKKGVSALEIHRQTGISYKSCLFMLNRIRFAMADSFTGPLGENGGIVECDELHIGGKPRHINNSKKTIKSKKSCLMAMVERGGKVKTRPIADVTANTLLSVMKQNIDRGARIATDCAIAYTKEVERYFEGGHRSVNHSKREYVRGMVHTNTVEGFFSNIKRGLNGIYHSVSKEHLHRYISEFEFRYNNRELTDGERTVAAIRASEGKRLMYKEPVKSEK